jgi:sugar phosphate isomerase/epimerase
MTVATPKSDFEAASLEIAGLGYDGIEVNYEQLGTGIDEVSIAEPHGLAARNLLESLNLEVVALNAIDGSFQPHSDLEVSIDSLANQLRVAGALGAPRVLTWDGIAHERPTAEAIYVLTSAIEQALERSGLAEPPAICVEFHPFTLALARGAVAEVAAGLSGVRAGICLDFAHFGVALGPEFGGALTPDVIEAVDHVHWCDSDCRTEALHMPPGEGVLDLDALTDLLAPRDVILSFDLFGWPNPRTAMREAKDRYAAAVRRHAAAQGRG